MSKFKNWFIFWKVSSSMLILLILLARIRISSTYLRYVGGYLMLLKILFSRSDMLILLKIGPRTESDVTPSAPTLHQLLRTISIFLAGDHLVVPMGASHISLPQQEIQSREWEKKEQTNNMPGVNSSAEGKLCNTAFPVSICRITLAWILAEILQRY